MNGTALLTAQDRANGVEALLALRADRLSHDEPTDYNLHVLEGVCAVLAVALGASCPDLLAEEHLQVTLQVMTADMNGTAGWDADMAGWLEGYNLARALCAPGVID